MFCLKSIAKQKIKRKTCSSNKSKSIGKLWRFVYIVIPFKQLHCNAISYNAPYTTLLCVMLEIHYIK